MFGMYGPYYDSDDHEIEDDDDDDNDDDNDDDDDGDRFVTEAPVCRYFTQYTGCSRGAGCPNKHLSEEGECLRCGQILRLADVEQHCNRLCALRQRSQASNTQFHNNNSNSITTPFNTNDLSRRSTTATTSNGAFMRRRSSTSHNSDVESFSPTSSSRNRFASRATLNYDATHRRFHLSSDTSNRTPPLAAGSLSHQPHSQHNSSHTNTTTTKSSTSSMLNHQITPSINPASRTRSSLLPSAQSSTNPIVSTSKVLWKKDKVCRFHLKGCCTFNRSCKFLHLIDQKCVLCELPTTNETLDRHLQTCVEYKLLKSEMEKSQEVDCPICFNRLSEVLPYDTTQRSNNNHDEPRRAQPISREARVNRFALLPDCGHLFCLKCIMSWRKEGLQQQQRSTDPFEEHQEGRYRCPICRKETRFIIPCNRVIEGRERCDREKEIFVHSLRPCRFFSRGNCRNGARCQYAHVGPDGLPVAPRQQRRHHNSSHAYIFHDLFGGHLVGHPLASIFAELQRELGLDNALHGGLSDDDDDEEDSDNGLSGLRDMRDDDDDDDDASMFNEMFGNHRDGSSNRWNSRTFVLNPPSPLTHSTLGYSSRNPNRTRRNDDAERRREDPSNRSNRMMRQRGTSAANTRGHQADHQYRHRSNVNNDNGDVMRTNESLHTRRPNTNNIHQSNPANTNSIYPYQGGRNRGMRRRISDSD